MDSLDLSLDILEPIEAPIDDAEGALLVLSALSVGLLVGMAIAT